MWYLKDGFLWGGWILFDIFFFINVKYCIYSVLMCVRFMMYEIFVLIKN